MIEAAVSDVLYRMHLREKRRKRNFKSMIGMIEPHE
jgi:hypothetical protein